MATPTVGMTLRMPPDLRERIAVMAAAERRSVTQQIVVMLEKAAETSRPASADGATAAGHS